MAKAKENIVALFSQIEGMKGVRPDLIIEALKEGIVAAYKKQYGQAQNVEVTYDENTGEFSVFSVREVVDEVFDSRLEISLEDARRFSELYEVGDKIRFQEDIRDFARSSIGVAKQNVLRKLKEEEQKDILNEYKSYEGEMISGIVDRLDERAIYIKLGRLDAMLLRKDQIFKEHYRIGERISVFVTEVKMTQKGPRVFVSRTAPDMLKRMFEKEVPEVFDGTVEIMSIAREAGDRAKIVVRSHNEKVDAIGTMVGRKGSNIQPIINDLHGENMDIIEWSADRGTLVRNVLKPAQVNAVYVFDDGSALAVVPDNQLTLAIGKKGQNVRLAAQVAHCKIDIKKESDFDESEIGEIAPQESEIEEIENLENELEIVDAEEISPEEQVGLEELLDNMELPDKEDYEGDEE
ncbi:MAG: transcription termination factor NusA [Streptococcaceae bacterium]|jgi:N utilization substance protein A|nr:transcription termination factor NusA [Streptococcaceae bacterium]